MLPLLTPLPIEISRGGRRLFHHISTFQHEISVCLAIEKWDFYLMQGLDSLFFLLAGQTTTNEYTGRNVTGKDGRPHPVDSYSEINLLAHSMQNRLGLCYKTLLINCHCQTHGGNAVISYTVNLSFRILDK